MSMSQSRRKRNMQTRKVTQIWERVMDYNRGDVGDNCSSVSLPLQHHSFTPITPISIIPYLPLHFPFLPFLGSFRQLTAAPSNPLVFHFLVPHGSSRQPLHYPTSAFSRQLKAASSLPPILPFHGSSRDVSANPLLSPILPILIEGTQHAHR